MRNFIRRRASGCGEDLKIRRFFNHYVQMFDDVEGPTMIDGLLMDGKSGALVVRFNDRTYSISEGKNSDMVVQVLDPDRPTREVPMEYGYVCKTHWHEVYRSSVPYVTEPFLRYIIGWKGC